MHIQVSKLDAELDSYYDCDCFSSFRWWMSRSDSDGGCPVPTLSAPVMPESEYKKRIDVSEDIQPLGENPLGEYVRLYIGASSLVIITATSFSNDGCPAPTPNDGCPAPTPLRPLRQMSRSDTEC
jgi:hypothetical protein